MKTVLFTDGEFRLVRTDDPFGCTGPFIQHHHPELDVENYNGTSFDWDGWVYCMGYSGACKHCEAKVPKPMSGLKKLVEWKR